MYPSPKAAAGKSAAIITVLTLVFLAAMGAATPPAPIAFEKGSGDRGFLVDATEFSDILAEQIAGRGYTYLAIDFTRVDIGGRHDHWKREVDAVRARGCPVWGWVEIGDSPEHALAVAKNLALDAMYLIGPGAVENAPLVRSRKPGLRVIPVVAANGARPDDGEYAVVLDLERFQIEKADLAHPILAANQLSATEILTARESAGASYLIARIPLR